MFKLILLNLAIIIVSIVIIIMLKKIINTEKKKNLLLLIASILTIVCHYSSLIYHIKDNQVLSYLESNPNLILPIYPCNVVMWCCLVLGLSKNKESKVSKFLIDYIFFFGIVSCAVGLFFNVDFIRNPSLKDFDVTKGILAHGFMLFNVLVLKAFGYVKFDCLKNMKNIFIGVILMLACGLYCNLVFTVLVSKDYAYSVNSMFLIHSPFDDSKFLTYPIISILALILYLVIFTIIDLFKNENGNRWFNKLKRKEIL